MSKFLRTAFLVLGVLLLAALLVGLGYRLYWMFSGQTTAGLTPMMRGAWDLQRQPHQMDRFGIWPGAFLFGGLPFFGVVIGIGLLVLAGIGVASLFRKGTPAEPAPRCAHCGAELRPGWVACPRCGEKV